MKKVYQRNNNMVCGVFFIDSLYDKRFFFAKRVTEDLTFEDEHALNISKVILFMFQF